MPIVGDVRQVLLDLLRRYEEIDIPAEPNQTKQWLGKINEWRQDYPLVVPHYPHVLSPQEVIVEVATQAPHAYYTTDVGQHQMWSAQFLKNGPRQWISSAGLGTMGFGLPAAMGVKVAFPQEQVICIAGDASIQMNIQELGTLAQYGINAKVVIVNNRWQGMVRQWQEAFYEERYSSSNMERGMPDFVKLAEAYGVKGMQVSKREDLADAIATMLTTDSPFILDVIVSRDENCYPMVAPGKSNADMIGLQEPVSRMPKTIITCPNCGTENPQDHRFCGECGTKF